MILRPALVAIGIALVVAGCGPTPPQAPLAQAKKLDSSTSAISTACGESYQVTAFPGDHRRDLRTLEATAASASHELAGVYRLNPAWIYQGETIAKIVQDGISSLHSCGLHGAAAELGRLTQEA